MTYRCEDESQVTNLGQIFDLTCSSEGDLIAPDPWPDCRAASVCTNIPEAPVESKLKNTGDFTSVKEFQNAAYPCKGTSFFLKKINYLSKYVHRASLIPKISMLFR